MTETLSGYVSWIGVCQDFLIGSSGKLAALWFDELILQLPHPDFIASFLSAEGQPTDQNVLDELARIWVPAHKYIPSYDFLSRPWQSDHPLLVDIVSRITREQIRRESPELSETDFSFRFDLAREGAGLLDTMDLWLQVSSKKPCSFLPVWREHLVLQELSCAVTGREPFDLFSEIVTYKLPDLESHPWERIVELRHNPFLQEFRQRVAELHHLIDSGASTSVPELVDEMMVEDMTEMVQLFRPAPMCSVAKAIVCNLPLPIPINPAALLFDALELKREHEVSKKYGWLYFLLDLNPTHSQGNDLRVGGARSSRPLTRNRLPLPLRIIPEMEERPDEQDAG